MFIIFMAQQKYYSLLRNMNTTFEAYEYFDLLWTLRSSHDELLESTVQHAKCQTDTLAKQKKATSAYRLK